MGMTPEELRAAEDAELARMKQQIALPEFLIDRNWVKDKAGSGGDYTTLRRGSDKLVVSQQDDRAGRKNWVWADAHNKAPGGSGYADSIIGYMMTYEGARSIGHARGMIRRGEGWPDPRRQDHRAGRPAPPAPVAEKRAADEVTPGKLIAEDIEKARSAHAIWQGLSRFDDFTYTGKRFLDDDLVREHSFLMRQFTDRDMPDCDTAEGLQRKFVNPVFGYLAKVEGDVLVAGFDRRYYVHGERRPHMHGKRIGLWLSHATSTPGGFEYVVFAESPISALSYQQLKRLPRAMLVAFGGHMHQLQPALIKQLCEFLCDARVVLAMDNDTDAREDAGARYVAEITKLVPRAEPDRPEIAGMDWNDVLVQQHR